VQNHHSCVAFTQCSTPCYLENYASYSINVSNADDIATLITLVRQHNIRLIVKKYDQLPHRHAFLPIRRSFLTRLYGLGSGDVLEWEVMTDA
jgi:hypothetical protein